MARASRPALRARGDDSAAAAALRRGARRRARDCRRGVRRRPRLRDEIRAGRAPARHVCRASLTCGPDRRAPARRRVRGHRRDRARLVGLVTLLVFLPALGNQFVNWDDEVNLISNPHFRGLGPAQVRWMFATFHAGHYIPVTWLSFGLDYVLWGMRPAGYHATSVALHTVDAILFYFVARRLLRSAVQADPRSLTFGAIVAALLFSLHPLRVEIGGLGHGATRRAHGLLRPCSAWLAYLRAVDRGRRRCAAPGMVLDGDRPLRARAPLEVRRRRAARRPAPARCLSAAPSAAGPGEAAGRALGRLAIEKVPVRRCSRSRWPLVT